jgi:ribonuclease P protein component
MVGFVVGRAVGPAVTRNQVRRRLQHLIAARLDRLPAGTRLVVRATPGAAGRSSAARADALDAALVKAYS